MSALGIIFLCLGTEVMKGLALIAETPRFGILSLPTRMTRCDTFLKRSEDR
jgi:hypothetical protein